MKRTALAGLFICAVMSASPVFAAETIPAEDDLCAINLNKINNAMATSGQTSENTDTNLQKEIAKAKAYHESGKSKECIDVTSQVLQKLQNMMAYHSTLEVI